MNFHPSVQDWFSRSYREPTPAQRRAWPAIQRRDHVLVAAPTGSGKTLCAFLSALDELAKEALEENLPDETRVLYVSPLKALSNDIERNLATPLAAINQALEERGHQGPPLRSAVRTGDTTAKDRAQATKRPPHLYVTTPESLYILLTSEGGRRMLSTVRTVIVDEIHALIGDKRGAHLALSLERLEHLVRSSGVERLQRIGLSATQKPIDEVARFLTGDHPCEIVDVGHQRALDVSLCIPDSPLEAVLPAEAWTEIYDQLARLITEHDTTLIFTNTRRLSERITRFVAERIGEGLITSHHGSLSRKLRHDAERRLKEGKLKALVATASMELGIDVGEVDLVCQIESPKSIATLLQRVGRSGHFVGGTPKGRVFPTSRDDLVECIALLQAIHRGELDAISVSPAPLDILAQQIVAQLVPGEMAADDLYRLSRRAYPYRNLSRAKFDEVVEMLTQGFSTTRGRRGAYVHHDRVEGMLRARRNARLSAITSGGAIPDNFDYDVQMEPTQIKVGTVNEDFAVESMPGDIFQLGNTSYQIEKVDPGVVRVRDARGLPPTIPFWLGEAPSRTDELSLSVSRLRERVARQADRPDLVAQELRDTVCIPEDAARQAVEHLASTHAALGVMPTQRSLVAERFFDETGGMHVVLHAPYGSRLTRALGLALRKRFCRSFNVELQAAATEDALVLSLGPMHSFPLEDIFSFLHPQNAEKVLEQALLDAPMFQTRFRWNASRSLAVLRFRSGRRVAPRIQRMESDDLLAVCFPDQVACLENIPGDREIPEHPLVEQSIFDCLHEAMDAERLVRLLEGIQNGAVSCHARDVTEPSPQSHEILTARPYAYLDDAPLEERRTQAVQMRRLSTPETTSDLGKLDAAAVQQVIEEVRPDPRDPAELHDALSIHGYLTEDDLKYAARLLLEREDDSNGKNDPGHISEQARHLVEPLLSSGRAFCLPSRGQALYCSDEWKGLFSALGKLDSAARDRTHDSAAEPEEALLAICRARLEMTGPVTAPELARELGVGAPNVERALGSLEAEGFVLRGSFRQGTGANTEGAARQQENATIEFCERRLLARIHRYTLGRLRREIEPVTPAQFVDFLTRWQGLAPGHRKRGIEGTLAVVEQLAGFRVPAAALEEHILPARVDDYDAGYLDVLCTTGQVAWTGASKSADRLTRATPLLLAPRETNESILFGMPTQEQESSPADDPNHNDPATRHSADARRVAAYLKSRGASFFSDLVRETGLLRSRAEAAISELSARGLCTTDGFSGLRTLITPESKRRERATRARLRRPRPGKRAQRQGGVPLGLESAGRISWLENGETAQGIEEEQAALEAIAWQLLLRWGVVFRKLLEREAGLPPWRHLVRVFLRLEARGEIRGGRFVSRFSGQQFALPEAVSELRKGRREGSSTVPIFVNATDPLNLAGIVTPDQRVARNPNHHLLLMGGQYVTSSEAGTDLGRSTDLNRPTEQPTPGLARTSRPH